jgi:hypothetical protein
VTLRRRNKPPSPGSHTRNRMQTPKFKFQRFAIHHYSISSISCFPWSACMSVILTEMAPDTLMSSCYMTAETDIKPTSNYQAVNAELVRITRMNVLWHNNGCQATASCLFQSLVDFATTTPLQDECVTHVPIEIVSELLVEVSVTWFDCDHYDPFKWDCVRICAIAWGVYIFWEREMKMLLTSRTVEHNRH